MVNAPEARLHEPFARIRAVLVRQAHQHRETRNLSSNTRRLSLSALPVAT
jgi:hypothetical protein